MHGVVGGRKGVTARPPQPLCRNTHSHPGLFSALEDALFFVKLTLYFRVGLIVRLVH